MTRQNVILLNVSAGETTPEIFGRIDLPAYQRSYQRVQNYEVLPQGALRYRNGTQHVHNTKSLGKGRLIPFTFNQVDTYMLEFTDRHLQFYRALSSVLNDTVFSIASISNADPGVVTTTAPHGFASGQEVYLSGIQGMIELNDQFFLITVLSATTFTLKNLFGTAIDTTNFFAADAATGTVATAYGISSPYLLEDLNQVHISQSGDTVILTHQDYMPYKLTRTALTSWAINFFTRTGPDPFGQGQVTAVTLANPGVFTLANHGFKVGDTLYFDGWVSAGGTWEIFNRLPRTFTVNTVPSANTFTVSQNGNPIDTTTFGASTTKGHVIDTMNAPQSSAYLGMSRLCYTNTRKNPSGIVASKLPDPTTGATKFDDFTPGANDNDAFYFTLSPVFNQQDAIQWVATNNQVIVLGCAGSIRQLTGSSGPTSGVTPSSIQANAISNTGAAPIQPYSNGLTVYYVDQTTYRVSSFVFSIQVYNYVTVNQNLIANQLSTSKFIQLSQQRRESSLLWILREDGVLAGMTFNEIESVYGWHRHYLGGASDLDGVHITRAKVLSCAVEPRLNQDAVLWLIVERTLSNGHVYRSVEYWNEHVKFYDLYDYFGGVSTNQGMAADVRAYKNATSEQLKRSIHLDCNTTYDGAQRGIAASAALSFGPAPTPPVPPPARCTGSVFVPQADVGYPAYQNNERWYNERNGNKTSLLAISPTYDVLYVAVAVNAFADAQILKIDTTSGAVVAQTTVQFARQPQQVVISPDGSLLYVYTYVFATLNHEINVFNTADMSLNRTILNASLHGFNISSMDITANGAGLLLSDYDSNRVLVFDVSAFDAMIATNIAGATSITAACWKDNFNFFVQYVEAANDHTDEIFEYDATGNYIATHTLFGLRPPFAGSYTRKMPMGVHPVTGYLYGHRGQGNSVDPAIHEDVFWVYDPATGITRGYWYYDFLDTTGNSMAVRFMGFDPGNTSAPYYAYYVTEDSQLIRQDDNANAWRFDLTAMFPTLDTLYAYSGPVIDGNCGFIYLYAQKPGPGYDAHIVTVDLSAQPVLRSGCWIDGRVNIFQPYTAKKFDDTGLVDTVTWTQAFSTTGALAADGHNNRLFNIGAGSGNAALFITTESIAGGASGSDVFAAPANVSIAGYTLGLTTTVEQPLALSQDGLSLYVAAADAGHTNVDILRINTADGTVAAVFATGVTLAAAQGASIMLSPDDTMLYVALAQTGDVYQLNSTTMVQIQTATFLASTNNICLDVSSDGSTLVIATVNAVHNKLEFVDTATFAITTVDLTALFTDNRVSCAAAFRKGTTNALVCGALNVLPYGTGSPNMITEIDSGGTVVNQFNAGVDLSDAQSVGVDPVTGDVYAVVNNGNVYVYDLTSSVLLQTVAFGVQVMAPPVFDRTANP